MMKEQRDRVVKEFRWGVQAERINDLMGKRWRAAIVLIVDGRLVLVWLPPGKLTPCRSQGGHDQDPDLHRCALARL